MSRIKIVALVTLTALFAFFLAWNFKLRAEAEKITAAFSVRQRIVFTAWALGVALSNPEVEKIAGCKKSVLSEELSRMLRKIERQMHEDYADEDSRGRELLLTRVRSAIAEICSQPNNSPETWQTRLFSLAADIEQ